MTAWVRREDRHNQFLTCPYQQAPSPPMTPALHAACERAVHVVTSEGHVLRAGRATLYILERLGWGWIARLLALPPLIWVVEIGYGLVAANRPFFARFLFTREHDTSSDTRTGPSAC